MNVPPRVSIIVPCFNEEATIGGLLEAIRRQSHPLDDIEVVIADGMSDDGTRERIAAYGAAHPDLVLRLVDNPKRIIPAALNRAVEAARGEVIIRMDAHSIPAPDYVERCLETLESTGAANAGGLWEIHPGEDTWIARGIAAAAAHPLGAGGARYRVGGEAGPVETVPFGAFRREWLDRVGPFNESLHTNEDYEYNVRIHRAGGEVWFDPRIRSVYLARPNLRALARQYARYGYWKARMLRRHLGTLKPRQAIPALFVGSLLALAALSSFVGLARALLGVELGLYLSLTIGAGVLEALRRKDALLAASFALALWTMHIAWGTAFLWGMLGNASSR